MAIQDYLTQQHLRKHLDKLERVKTVYIYSNEWRAYWRPNGCGYCDSIKNAGIYTIEEAWRRVSGVGPEKKIVIIKVT